MLILMDVTGDGTTYVRTDCVAAVVRVGDDQTQIVLTTRDTLTVDCPIADVMTRLWTRPELPERDPS